MKLNQLKVALTLALICPLTLTAQATKSAERTDAESPKASGPTYRLTYTVTESEGAKRLGVQHFALTLTSTPYGGPLAELKTGSKVPVVTGSYNVASAQALSQFSYIDVGLNISARLKEYTNGQQVETKVEQSSVAEQSNGETHQPVVRQAVLQTTALLALGKPLILGSLDTPASLHHLEVEVVLELVR